MKMNDIKDFLPDAPECFEIMPGMTVEEMRSMFFDRDTLVEPAYKVYQLNSGGHRYYYRFDEKGNPEFFPSVTTILSQTLPKGEFLIKWIANKGYEAAQNYKIERARYGTFMHAQFELLIISRKYDLDELKDRLRMFIESEGLPSEFINYADDLKKDVLAFAQFVIDYDVKPLAVEVALVHPHYKYAGLVDLPCTMLEVPGGKKRITAIVDFKSGRNGFWEENEVQIHMYKALWNINFPNMQVDRVFNLSPKDWYKRPSYHLKDQTGSPNAKKIPALLELAAIEDAKRGNIFTHVSGLVDLSESFDLSENITALTLSELVKNKTQQKAPEGPGISQNDLRQDETPQNATKKTEARKAEVKKKKRAVAPKKNTEPKKAVKTPQPEPPHPNKLLNDLLENDIEI